MTLREKLREMGLTETQVNSKAVQACEKIIVDEELRSDIAKGYIETMLSVDRVVEQALSKAEQAEKKVIAVNTNIGYFENNLKETVKAQEILSKQVNTALADISKIPVTDDRIKGVLAAFNAMLEIVMLRCGDSNNDVTAQAINTGGYLLWQAYSKKDDINGEWEPVVNSKPWGKRK